MECNKPFQEAIRAIDFRYKLDDTVTELLEKQPNAKMTKDQFLGYLAGKGVTANEIKVSGISNYLDGYIATSNNKSIDVKMIYDEIQNGGHYINLGKSEAYKNVT